MKRILCISFLIMALAFVAMPPRAEAQKVIQWPWGAADFQTLTADSLTETVIITNSFTYADFGTLDTVLTVNVGITSGINAGALLFVKTKSDATGRNVTWGTGVDAAVLTGVASKTILSTFVFDGTKFYGVAYRQLD